MSTAHLVDAWLRTTARVGARGDVVGAGAALLGRYAGAGRAYHDLSHLDDVLRNVDELVDFAREPDNVRLAAWFHDAVYDPRAEDNEERSARLAGKVLAGLHVGDARAAEVARLVRVTATHDAGAGDVDAAVLCDADLAILAADRVRYDRYVEAVRREYAHVSDEDFAKGRAAVLHGLIAHDPLFRTPAARAEWEAPARANIAAELDRLSRVDP